MRDNKTTKILSWDIETLPNTIARYSLWHQGDPSCILEERSIICIAYKWLHEKKTHLISVENTKDVHDDKSVLRKFRRVHDQADMTVAHNGNKFDLPVVNSRLVYWNMPPLTRNLRYDTLSTAKRVFSFNSNRLDYLGQFLGVGGKRETPKGLWLDCLKGDAKAIKEMGQYCKRDVKLLEDVYLKLKPFDENHPNLNVFGNMDVPRCPGCQSDNVVKWGFTGTKTQRYQRYRCKDCGMYPRERLTSLPKSAIRLT